MQDAVVIDEGVKEEALKYGKYVLPNDDEHQVIIFDKIVLEVPLEVDEKEIEEEVAPLEEVQDEQQVLTFHKTVLRIPLENDGKEETADIEFSDVPEVEELIAPLHLTDVKTSIDQLEEVEEVFEVSEGDVLFAPLEEVDEEVDQLEVDEIEIKVEVKIPNAYLLCLCFACYSVLYCT